MTAEQGKPSLVLPLMLGLVGLVVGGFVTAEMGWNFGPPGGLETLGRDLATGGFLFFLGGFCLGLVLNFVIGRANSGDGE